MHFSSEIDPQLLFITPKQAIEILGVNRNELRSFMLKKQLDWNMVCGQTMLYRTSVEALKARMDNAGKVHNPYAKQEGASHVSP